MKTRIHKILLPLLFLANFTVQNNLLGSISEMNWSLILADGETISLQEKPNTVGLPVALPKRSLASTPVPIKSWHGVHSINLQFAAPKNIPEEARIIIFVNDWDDLWYQRRINANTIQFDDKGNFSLSLPITGDAAKNFWTPTGHKRVWHTLTPGKIKEFGFGIEVDKGINKRFSGELTLKSLELVKEGNPIEPKIRDVILTDANPKVNTPFEFRIFIDAEYKNPFKTRVKTESQMDISCVAFVELPDGKTERINGFYYENFIYANPSAVDVRDLLLASGEPHFRIRYTGRQPGRHSIRIYINLKDNVILEHEQTVNIVAPEKDQITPFVYKDPKNPLLIVDQFGTPFWGIGMNVRSPTDERYWINFPEGEWRDEGLMLYKRLFETYRDNGINVVEFWMCDWWLGLEGIAGRRPGYHGMGWMNQKHAWMLDRIFEWAHEYGIYIVLTMNNHGRFSTRTDAEWEYNPYNIENGGISRTPDDFFSNIEASLQHTHYMRYIVARWGAYPNLLVWKLCSEIDLTGTRGDFYTRPEMVGWHRRMAEIIREADPYDHMIGTHWMMNYTQLLRSPDICRLPELDVLMTDAYYGDNERARATSTLLNHLYEGQNQINERFNKHLLVTEYGGTPMGDFTRIIEDQSKIGVWAGFFSDYAVAPMFWWHQLVDEKNLYQQYRVISDFTRNEDRTQMTKSKTSIRVGNEQLGAFAYRHKEGNRLLLYLYDTQYFYNSTKEKIDRTVAETQIRLPFPLQAGTYKVEYWDTQEGFTRTDNFVISANSNNFRIMLPAFREDIALKIYSQENQTE